VLVGAPIEYDAVPWFWSNQYDLKLKSVGLMRGADTSVLRGDPDARSFSVAYLRDGVLIALDSVNQQKDFLRARQLVRDGSVLDPLLVADPLVDLKESVVS
jgi:3-phenylpropionate/trans-cinnamate dioxygenase ferredoxin reductase subunit